MENDKIHELDIKLTKIEASDKSAHKRIDDVEETNIKLSSTVQSNVQDIQKTTLLIEGLGKTVSEIQESVKSINQLALSVHEIASEMKAMRTDVTDVVGRVKAIEDKPAKRWETVVEKIVLVVVGGLVAFMMTKIGM